MPPPSQGLTAYHDISLDKCYVIELNTTIVLPPRNFWELLMNVKVGSLLLFTPVPSPKGGVWDMSLHPKGSLHHSLATYSESFPLFLCPTHRMPSELAFRCMLWVSSEGSRCRPYLQERFP